MTEKAFIVSAENNKILASTFRKEECASCNVGCGKNKDCFEILNPKEFPVKKGDTVFIGANKFYGALQGIVSLFVPVLCSVAGYFAAPFIMSKFGKTISGDGKAVFVLIFLFVSSLAVFIVTRKFPIPGKPEIVEVE